MPTHLAQVDEAHKNFSYPRRILYETVAATVASVLVSPLVSIIDQSIVKRVTTEAPLGRVMMDEFKFMVQKPRAFASSPTFVMTVIVYWGTYMAANLSQVFADYASIQQKKTTKVLGATVANVSLLAWRDSRMVRLFGVGNPTVPQVTRVLFGVRDFSTMMATFYAAPAVARHISMTHGTHRPSTELMCALVIPTVVQAITSPIHMIAIDLSNRPNATDRIARMVSEYRSVTFGRCLRILPAFGLGSRTNTILREKLYEQ